MEQYYTMNNIMALSDMRNTYNSTVLFWKTAAINRVDIVKIGKHIVFPEHAKDVMVRELNIYAASHPKIRKDYVA